MGFMLGFIPYKRLKWGTVGQHVVVFPKKQTINNRF